MTTLELQGVSAGYGKVTVLHDIAFRMSADDGVVALMGANGAGKTTLCRTIAGSIAPTRGEIRVDETAVRARSPRSMVASGIVLVPEGRLIFSSMTVEENLRMGAYLRSDRTVDTDIQRMYERFPILGTRRQRAAGVLSGGEQQMLAIARALMANPQFLMLDEPTHGLAPSMVDEVIATVNQLPEDGVSVLLVEQNVRVAEATADRVLLMSNGRIVGDGPAVDMFAGEAIQHAYLGGDVAAVEQPPLPDPIAVHEPRSRA